MEQQDSSISDIDLAALAAVFKSNFKSISLITTLFAIISVSYSLYLPNLYSSKAVLEFVNKGQSFGSLGSGGLSSQALGLISSFSGSSGNQQSHKLIQKLNSREFIINLMENEKFLPFLMGVDSFNPDFAKTYYNSELVDAQTFTWKGDISKINISMIQRKFKSSLILNVDQNSNLLNLSITSKSPEAAYQLVTIIIQEINEISRLEALKEANNSIEFLVSELSNTSQNDIRSAISQLISSQLSIKMLANTTTEYALKVFDEPYLPEYKSSPNRALISILGTMSGFIVSLLLTIIQYYRRNL